MGVVARQSFKAGIVTYLGMLIGILNIIVVFPLTLTISQLGEIQLVLSSAQMLGSVILFGGPLVITKFYPRFKNDSLKSSALFGLLFLIPIGVMGIVFLASLYLKENIIQHFSDAKGSIANVSFWSVLVISFLMAMTSLFSTISALFGRIAIPSLFSNFIKVYLPVLSIALLYNLISYEQVYYLLFLFYIIILFVTGLYSFRIGNFSINVSIKQCLRVMPLKAIFAYSGVNILAGIAYSLANQVDILMVTGMIDTHSTGLYVWCLFIGNAIIIPLGLISNVSGPIIADNWKKQKLHEIQEMYSKSASTLITLGILLFSIFFLSIDDLYDIMPKGDEFRQAKWLVVLIGLSKLVDMSFGINHIILTYSSYFRLNLLFIVISALLNILLNLVLIPIYGLIGCGIATLVSVTIFNICKWRFLLVKFNLDPFTVAILANLSIGAFFLLTLMLAPGFRSPYLNIAFFSGVFSVLYLFTIHRFGLAPGLSIFAMKQKRLIYQRIYAFLKI